MFYLPLSLFSLLHNFCYFLSSMFLFPPSPFSLFSFLNVFYSPPLPPPPHLCYIFFHPQIHRPPIDPTSTPHRPLIDPTSTPHRPLIDPSSTLHRPLIDLLSTLHRPHIDPSSTLHRPHIDPSSTPHRPYIDPRSTAHRSHIDPTLNFFLTQLRE